MKLEIQSTKRETNSNDENSKRLAIERRRAMDL